MLVSGQDTKVDFWLPQRPVCKVVHGKVQPELAISKASVTVTFLTRVSLPASAAGVIVAAAFAVCAFTRFPIF
jgi:hypothetical protein